MRSSSPLLKALGVAFFCSSQTLAASAVIGIDLGTEFIKASLVKPGIPLEIVLTKDSRRKETSCIAFKPAPGTPKLDEYPERSYGSDALALAARFPSEVYPNLKTLLGQSLGSPVAQEYIKRHPALQAEENAERGTVAFGSKAFAPGNNIWMVEELLAMELQSIRKNAQALAGSDSPISAAVITVPPFFTTEEKRSVHLAAKLAGLDILDLISDGVAVGLNYATTRQFPSVSDGLAPEYHLVFDMGAGSTKATVLRFQSRSIKDVGKYNKTVQEVQVMGYGWDRALSGDVLNALIIDDMAAKFVETPKAQAISATSEKLLTHGRATSRLTQESQRLRHVLSANVGTQANFEGLFEDIDFKYKLTRTDFEEMVAPYIERVGSTVQSALTKASLEVSDLTSIILHGGASRTPFVRRELEKVIGSAEKIRSSVNSDESAVMGAVFRGADISPSFRVKEIRLFETTPYSTGVKWINVEGKLRHQRVWSPLSVLGAAPKEVTLPALDNFEATFYQTIEDEDREVMTLQTTNMTASVAELKGKFSCAEADIRFKVAASLSREDGEIIVSKAYVECEAEIADKEGIMGGVKNLFGFGKRDQKPLVGEGSIDTDDHVKEAEEIMSSSSKSADDSESTPAADTKETKKEVVSVPVGFATSEKGISSLSKASLKTSLNRLKAFEASDLARRQREEALNQLEAFSYKASELPETEGWQKYATEAERTSVLEKSAEYGDWVYGDGADAAKADLDAKLEDLQSIVNRVTQRIEEHEKRPELLEKLQSTLSQSTDYVSSLRAGIKEYKDWHASASASSDPSSEATASPSTTSADADSDSDADSKDAKDAKKSSMQDVIDEIGPVPPVHEEADLQDLDKLVDEVRTWLDETIPKQAALNPTDDAILTITQLDRFLDRFERAGLELTMKGVRNFERKKEQEAKKEKAAKAAKDKAAKEAAKKAKEEAAAAAKKDVENDEDDVSAEDETTDETADDHDEL
ncbi:lumenal Hsp70 protein [Ceratocystis pirilliformis]|uniref:Lumenal Hsp70 protein n=1 Tax=Ceratocystis pirilliformis TaxID=259994 RepID=A0ABR3YZG0_9PEZI